MLVVINNRNKQKRRNTKNKYEIKIKTICRRSHTEERNRKQTIKIKNGCVPQLKGV